MAASFHQILSRLRKEKKISQRQAASALGISQALLSHYENGVREPGLDFLLSACAYYGVSADYLLGRTAYRDTLALSPTELDYSDPYLMAGVELLRVAAGLEDAEQRELALSLLAAFFYDLAPREGDGPNHRALVAALLNLRRAQLEDSLAKAGYALPEVLRRRTEDELASLFTNE